MKIVKTRDDAKTGKRIVTVELDAGEELLAVRSGMYRLGYPMDDMVVASHHITELKSVTWCAIAQKWVE